jgi:hypothetical protein
MGQVGQDHCVCNEGYGKNRWVAGQVCIKAPCLDMTESDWHEMPSHATPTPACTDKVFEDTCELACNVGYTNSDPPTSRATNRATFACSAGGGNGRGSQSIWTGQLACNPVDCGVFQANTNGEVVDPSTNAATQCNGVFGAECIARCISGYYECPQDAHDSRAHVTYQCEAPASGKGAKGRWVPANLVPRGSCVPSGDGVAPPALACKAGALSVDKSLWLGTNETDPDHAGIQQTVEQKDFRNDVDTLEGYRMGAGTGPQYSFQFTAKDQQGNPRNYKNLGLDEDYVLVVFSRVPLSMLTGMEKQLQPREPPGRIDPSTGMWQGGTEKRYQSSKLPLTSKDADNHVSQPAGDDGADGRWHIDHQFEEHGIFFVSIFICETKSRELCDNKDPSHLVPGTGIPGGGISSWAEELQNKAFTVCPQGTSGQMQDHLLRGAQLSKCEAKDGFFSVNGPGRIATYCPNGFQCPNFPPGPGGKGATWPVAEPGYFVSSTLNLGNQYSWVPKMSKCGTLGACPGSSKFDPGNSICPQPGTVGNFDTVRPHKLTGQDDCYTTVPPNSCPGGCPKTSNDYTDACTGIGRCCDQLVGHRCCPGNAFGPGGSSCEICCTAESKEPSCDGRQWHSVGSNEGKHCEPCPDNKFGWLLAVPAAMLFIFGAPLFAKLAELAKHAGAIQGPLLSMMNFFQSSGEKIRHFFLNFLFIKMIILPRQARDKHRENSKKCHFRTTQISSWASKGLSGQPGS